MILRRGLVRSLFVMALVLAGVSSQPAFAQLTGGVEVDGEGVLRARFVNDPTGALLKQRLAEAKAGLRRRMAG